MMADTHEYSKAAPKQLTKEEVGHLLKKVEISALPNVRPAIDIGQGMRAQMAHNYDIKCNDSRPIQENAGVDVYNRPIRWGEVFMSMHCEDVNKEIKKDGASVEINISQPEYHVFGEDGKRLGLQQKRHFIQGSTVNNDLNLQIPIDSRMKDYCWKLQTCNLCRPMQIYKPSAEGKFNISEFSRNIMSQTCTKKLHIHNEGKACTCDVCEIQAKEKLSTCCDACKKAYLLNMNMRTHRPATEKPYTCEICQNKFTQISSLKTHMVIHTGIKSHACSGCNKTFYQKQQLQLHMRTHTGEKPYSCEICDSRFTQISSLKTHMVIHTGIKSHACEVCMKTFFQKQQLQLHMRTHTGEKPYSCEICQKKFSQISSLKSHTLIHTGTKSFICDVCKKAFSHKQGLQLHKRTHTGEKPYSCEICWKKFTQSSSLKLHMLLHTGKKPLVCYFCQNIFSSKRNLQQHLQTHTVAEITANNTKKAESLNLMVELS